MNNVSSQLMHLEQSGLKMNALAVMADINPSLMYRMRDGLRPCSFENALKLHAVTNGRFSVEQTHPKALCLVKSIFKKQGESNGMETQPNGTESQNIETGAVHGELAPQHGQAA